MVSLRLLGSPADSGTLRASLRKLSQSAICIAILAGAPGLGIRARAQSPDSGVPGNISLLPPSDNLKVIVVGLLGGFVHRNDPHHPETQLIHELQQQYPARAYFGLFENHKLNQAYKAIRHELDLDNNQYFPKQKKQPVRIVLFGHSWGAAAVVRLSRKLERDEIPVALTVEIDAVDKPFSDDSVIPANVAEAANFYQTHGLIHGRSLIRAADPKRTRIIGNFRRQYRTEPPECRHFPWYSRLFTKGDIEIECDPEVWSEVKTLLGPYLPSQAIRQDQPATSVRELAEPEAIETFAVDSHRR